MKIKIIKGGMTAEHIEIVGTNILQIVFTKSNSEQGFAPVEFIFEDAGQPGVNGPDLLLDIREWIKNQNKEAVAAASFEIRRCN